MPISQSGTAYDNAASVQRALTVADGRHSPRRHRADEQDHQRAAARAPPIDRHLRLSPLVTSYARRCSGFPNLFFSFESGAWKLLLLLSSGCSPGTELNRPTYRRSRQAAAPCARCVRPRLGSPRSARAPRNAPDRRARTRGRHGHAMAPRPGSNAEAGTAGSIWCGARLERLSGTRAVTWRLCCAHGRWSRGGFLCPLRAATWRRRGAPAGGDRVFVGD